MTAQLERLSPPGPVARLEFGVLRLTAVVSKRLLGGRGTGRAVTLLNRVFPRPRWGVFLAFGDRALRVRLSDRYWLPYVLGVHRYEPEVGAVLGLALDKAKVFIDCGANIGWWSVFASRFLSPDQIVAIEPSAQVFAELEANARLNGDAFRCVRAAVWSEDGKALTLLAHPLRHGSSALREAGMTDRPGYHSEEVPAATLDGIVERVFGRGTSGIVLKLDVERAETPALDGARSILPSVDLLIYEDHGRDSKSSATRFVKSLGMATFVPYEGRLVAVRGLDHLQSIKRDRRRGYNLFGCWPGTQAHALLERVELPR
jgi:FkbM family methyltransferase